MKTNKKVGQVAELVAQLTADKRTLEGIMSDMGEKSVSIPDLKQIILNYGKLLTETKKLNGPHGTTEFDAKYNEVLQERDKLREQLWNIIQGNVSNNKIAYEYIPQFVSITLGIDAKLLESATSSESSARLNAAARDLADKMRELIGALRAGNAINDELTAVGEAAGKITQPSVMSGIPAEMAPRSDTDVVLARPVMTQMRKNKNPKGKEPEVYVAPQEGEGVTDIDVTTKKNRSLSERSEKSELGHTAPSTPRTGPGIAPVSFSQPKLSGSLGAQSKKTSVMQNALSQAGVGGIYVPPASPNQPIIEDTPDESRAAQIRLEKIKGKWEELEWQEKKSNIVNTYAGGQAKDPDTINAVVIAACQQKLARLENTHMKSAKRPDEEKYMEGRVAKIVIYGEGAWSAKPAKSSDGQENKNVLDVFHEGTKIFEVRPGENKIQFCIPNPTAEQRVVAIEMFQEMCGIKGNPAKVRINCENNEAMKQLLAKDVSSAGIEPTNIQRPSSRPTND